MWNFSTASMLYVNRFHVLLSCRAFTGLHRTVLQMYDSKGGKQFIIQSFGSTCHHTVIFHFTWSTHHFRFSSSLVNVAVDLSSRPLTHFIVFTAWQGTLRGSCDLHC